MDDNILSKLDRSKLSQAEQIALMLVEKAKEGKGLGCERLARYCIDRDEGRATEHVILDKDTGLTDAECDQVRELIRANHTD